MLSRKSFRDLGRRLLAEEKEAIANKDLPRAIERTWGWPTSSLAPFVWPDTYDKIHYYQKNANGMLGHPVLMRGAKGSLHARYPRGQWAIKVFERYLRLRKPTIVDVSLAKVFQDYWHSRERFARFPVGYREALKGLVVINGRKVPLGADRIAEIEKGIRLIEKLDKIAERHGR